MERDNWNDIIVQSGFLSTYQSNAICLLSINWTTKIQCNFPTFENLLYVTSKIVVCQRVDCKIEKNSSRCESNRLFFETAQNSAARFLREIHRASGWPFRNNYGINVLAWVGALSTAVSRGSAPLVVGACRRGSTRLTAVIGGLVLALASLFTSFAAELHQVLLRWVTDFLTFLRPIHFAFTRFFHANTSSTYSVIVTNFRFFRDIPERPYVIFSKLRT